MAELMERKRLLDYLPRFMQNFSELKELLNAANDETDLINIQVGKILDEAFIDSCTEYGIKKYESICGIFPDDTDTLEERKARVKIRWNDSIPYTFAGLIRKLNVCCGSPNDYGIFADLEDYELAIYTHFGFYASVLELEKLMERMLPVNMHYDMYNGIEHELDAILSGGIVMMLEKEAVISSDLECSRAFCGVFFSGNVTEIHKEVVID